MNAFGFRSDAKITEVITSGRFTLSAEVIPPRNGTEQAAVLQQVEKLIQSGAEFLSVTKGAGGSLRGGSLPIAQSVKERFSVPCIAHFTCRDLTPQEIENQLMDHHYFGIRNILALRGDPPSDQKEWNARDGSYNYAHELIRQIRALNRGEYLSRPEQRLAGKQEATDFCIGAAVYPEHPNEDERARFFQVKVEAGAEFAITQMLFDVDAYSRFLDLCARKKIRNIPILVGTRLLKTRQAAERMAARFQVAIPRSTLDRLPDDTEAKAPDTLVRAVDSFMDFTERLKKAGAPGIHLFVLSDTTGSCEVLRKLRA